MQTHQCVEFLRQANEVAKKAVAQGHHPFGALLIAPDGHTVLLEQGNVDGLNHAESTLIKRAHEQYSREVLWQCTLVTTVEPCAMCAASQYWGHIGKLVYGVSEHDLLEITRNHEQNPTLNLPCREVFSKGQKPIEVWGPIAQIRQEILALHRDFWSKTSIQSN